jgi:hypothetical protein
MTLAAEGFRQGKAAHPELFVAACACADLSRQFRASPPVSARLTLRFHAKYWLV